VDASEGRLEYIHQCHSWTTWIDFSGPFWRSSTIPHQRNVGCRAAKGDIIAFCDAGLEPDSDWLATITAPLLSGKFTLDCGPVYAKSEGVYTGFNTGADGEIIRSAATANMAFLKSVFDRVNGFDERIFYGSDHDFVWRCENSQHPCYQVLAASMVMDFGERSLTMRRSWRYGRGWARLYGLHPERHMIMMKDSPERVVYPVWVLLGPFSFILATSRKLRWAPLLWLGILGLLLIRNRKAASPHAVVADHVIAGASVLDETARRIAGEVAPVIFLSDDHDANFRHLSDALAQQGTPVAFWRGPTKSVAFNFLVSPACVVILAWRGARIIHIHWTYGFSRSSESIGGRVAHWWFGIFLKASRSARLKIIWTAQNILPNEEIVNDHSASRRLLASRADAVITHSSHNAQKVSELFGVTNVAVIPNEPIGSDINMAADERASDNEWRAIAEETTLIYAQALRGDE
jgi:hypothetical protein